jgi:formamidopyrimidine-DNA glycosylase
VGNYLKSESLYFAGISPLRHVASIGDDDLARLNKTIKSVIRASYKTGGATIYTFQGFDGEKGEYTRRFAVYNQEKDPAGLEVTREVTDDGRTTFWVKGVQT